MLGKSPSTRQSYGNGLAVGGMTMPAYSRKLLAELLGTYVLLAFGGFAIFAANGPAGGAGPTDTGPLLIIAFGFGFALLIALYSFGEVSGGHFNPAVSLAALIDKRIDVSTFIMYSIAQVAGAVLAGLTLAAGVSRSFVGTTATVPGAGVSDTSVFLLEILFTAFFVAVILKVTESDKFGPTAFLAISFSLVGIHIAGVFLSGASVNPARTLGSALVGGIYTSLWIYMVAPFIGAFIGWAIYKLTTLEIDDMEDV
jgi:aquaporin Z